MKFKEFNLRKEHILALQDMYIENPTDIQSKVIPKMRKGKDILAHAQTGTGKTLAFLIPILESIPDISSGIKSLIIVPTRELSNQITDVLKYFQKYRSLSVVNASGGHNITTQIQKLSSNTDIVVGTPGRVLDLLRNGNINFKNIDSFVIDEMDQILAFGFLEDVILLMNKTPRKKQVCMFSATVSQDVKKLSKQFMLNPIYLTAERGEVVLDNISQLIVQTKDSRKLSSLIYSIEKINPFMCMIFCNSKKNAEKLYSDFIHHQYKNMELLHGEMSQNKRENILKKFRELKVQYLITTDLSARGMDIEGVSHVINYDIPRDVEYYIHRIGRTGRMNQIGYAISFVTEKDIANMKKIQKRIKKTIPVVYDTNDKEREKMEYSF
ncbi:DEAD/DEAH box helicase [Filifactor alocis]|uniref:DEAD/DEAH box helicase n=1 Tax=Filifactor alocis TaxID=143361 RepID=UPI0028EE77AA|nr:DEAD/DEAH box helicase [Filifactor alocis]